MDNSQNFLFSLPKTNNYIFCNIISFQSRSLITLFEEVTIKRRYYYDKLKKKLSKSTDIPISNFKKSTC